MDAVAARIASVLCWRRNGSFSTLGCLSFCRRSELISAERDGYYAGASFGGLDGSMPTLEMPVCLPGGGGAWLAVLAACPQRAVRSPCH